MGALERMTYGVVVCVLSTVLGSAHAQKTAVPMRVNESARDIPVAYDVDVGGVGGASRAVTAAISAANQGATVFLAASRSYLGEDLCSTYRLWLDPCDVLTTPLARALYAEPAKSVSFEAVLPFTYTADMSSADPHRDTSGCVGKTVLHSARTHHWGHGDMPYMGRC